MFYHNVIDLLGNENFKKVVTDLEFDGDQWSKSGQRKNPDNSGSTLSPILYQAD